MPKFKHAIIGLSLLLGAALESPAQILEAVQLIDDQPLLSSVTSIEISPDGRHLYAVSPAAQQVSAHARDAHTGDLSLIDSESYATAGNTSGQFGSQASLLQNAQFLLLGSLFENGRDLAMFQRDAASGELTLINAALLSLTADQRMLRFAVSPSGDFLYVLVLDIIDPTSTTNRTVDLRTYAVSDSGAVSLLDSRMIQDVGPAEVGESLLISPDGQHLYISGRRSVFASENIPGRHFSRNAATGALTLLGSLDALGQTNSQAAAIFSMDGMSLFYRSDVGSNPTDSAIGSLSREQSSGLLGFAGQTFSGGINWKGVDDALALAANDRLISRSKQTNSSSDQSIIIVKPSDGAEFEPGSMLAFSIQGKYNFDIQSVLLFSKEFGMEIDEPPFSGQVEIPVHLLGEVHLHAIAKDFAGNMTSAESITIYIKTDLDLVKLDVITGDVILLDASKIKKVGVSGMFSDGLTRDITNDPDTVYSIADKSIATVSVDGMVTPVSNGHTTLRVENSGVQDTVSVIVSTDTP